jgi:hypothetical protein
VQRWLDPMKRLIRFTPFFAAVFLATGCSCLSPRPYYVQEVQLSVLSQTTVVFDQSRYGGIQLIISNDSPSDIFLKFEPVHTLLSAPQEATTPFRLPDRDERYRAFSGTGLHPLMSADVFMYVWSGNKGFYSFPSPDLSRGVDHFLPITYYQCKDAGFLTHSVKIVTAKQAAQRTGASYSVHETIAASSAPPLPTNTIFVGMPLHEAKHILDAVKAKDISKNVGIISNPLLDGKEFIEDLGDHWFILADNTCLHLTSGRSRGQTVNSIQSITLGEKSRGYPGQDGWMNQKHVAMQRFDL